MPSCPRCATIVDGGSGYCWTCGRPRIAESLRLPAPDPIWLRPLQLTLLAVVSLWLLVTVGVAFLREWKAIRESRALLEQNRPAEAWNLLASFLPDHPQNKQALLLCGQATIRIGNVTQAKDCLAQLGGQSPELAKELTGDYRQALTAQARNLQCDPQPLEQLLGQASILGDPFPGSVVEGLDGVIDTCRAARNDYVLYRINSLVARKGKAAEMVQKGYVPAINKALSQGRYGDAKILSQQAIRLAPDQGESVEAVLGAERRKVSDTAGALRALCDNLKTDARYHPGNAWCFPATAPPAVQGAKDGWGKPFFYSVLRPGGAQGCNQGFAVSSYGQATTAEGEAPGIEITCRFDSGYETWQPPNRFWLERGGD